MSDQRLIVPSDTPSAWAACDVDKPSGLPLIFLIALFQRVLDGIGWSSSNCIGFRREPGVFETPFSEFGATSPRIRDNDTAAKPLRIQILDIPRANAKLRALGYSSTSRAGST